ncbi:MAG: Zn finger protein [Lokiarchaeia virus VerdaV4]|uniref:Zn finger protein n=1 Tax=Lokiarchaeia virus VerdaV4 TaxID=3070172 RepID=A0AA35CNH6_9CAUD|nr:MAG: Zn finger protein [Lokiarchaeia virus VerdaV4]BDI54960.1 MAG: Zn finger protein [Lokiarchaeia virus VerdaV4]
MIKCEICQEWLPEYEFHNSGICLECEKTPEAKEYHKKALESMKQSYKREQEMEQEFYDQVEKYEDW